MSSRAKFLLSLLGVLFLAAPATAQYEMKLEMSGMLAWAESGGGIEILLPNMFDEQGSAMHKLVHYPLLEVRCSDIDDKDLAEACKGWLPSTKSGYGSIPLTQGMEISFDFKGAKDVLKVDGSMSAYSWDLGKLLSTVPAAGKARSELLARPVSDPVGLRKLAVGRVRIESGRLSASKGSSTWSFGVSGSGPLATGVFNSNGLDWDHVLGSGGLVIRLQSFDKSVDIQLPIKAQSLVLVKLWNDPHPFEYCQQRPSKSHPESMHFHRFYDLTQVPKASIPALPLTQAEQPEALCPHGWGGKRVNCDVVKLAP